MFKNILKKAALVLVLAFSFLFAPYGNSISAGSLNSAPAVTKSTSEVVLVEVFIDGEAYWEVWIDGIRVAVIPQED